MYYIGKMVKRYYNLKQGKPDVMGHVIEVDTGAKLEERVKILTLDQTFNLSSYQLQPDRTLYEINLSSSEDRALNITIAVLNGGNTLIHDYPKNEKFYFNEIDSKKAKELVEGYNNWTSMQAWASDGPGRRMPSGFMAANDFL